MNVCFVPCNACRAGIRHCAAMEGSSWRRRWCSGRAWQGVLSHPSVGRKNSIKKGAFQIHYPYSQVHKTLMVLLLHSAVTAYFERWWPRWEPNGVFGLFKKQAGFCVRVRSFDNEDGGSVNLSYVTAVKSTLVLYHM